jgi:hypothetical protein
MSDWSSKYVREGGLRFRGFCYKHPRHQLIRSDVLFCPGWKTPPRPLRFCNNAASPNANKSCVTVQKNKQKQNTTKQHWRRFCTENQTGLGIPYIHLCTATPCRYP